MKKLKITTFAILGGILGFAFHLTWHSFTGVNLLSIGPHAIQGTVYTLTGTIIGILLYLTIPKVP